MASQEASELQGIRIQTLGGYFHCPYLNGRCIIQAWRDELNENANQFDDIIIKDIDTMQEVPLYEDLDPTHNYIMVNFANGKPREEFVQSLYFEYCSAISSQNAMNVHDYYINPNNDFFASLYTKYKDLFGPIKLGRTRYTENDFKTSVFRLEDCITKSFGKILTTEFVIYTIEQFRKHFIISEQLDIPGNVVDADADAEADAEVDADVDTDEPIVLVDDHVYLQQFTQLLDRMDNIQFSRNQRLDQYVRSFYDDYRESFFIMSDYAVDWEDEIKNEILDEFVEIFSPTILEDSELHRLLQMLKSEDESYYYNAKKKDGSIQYENFVKDAIYNVETHLLNLHTFSTDQSTADDFYEAMMILYSLSMKIGDDF